MTSAVLAISRLFVCAGWTVLLLPIQALAVGLRLPLARRVPMLYHRGCLTIMGLRVERHGRISRTQPTLFVSNHTSYLDITILGALIPGSFVAKEEVASWPVFGLLARLQRSVFVERRSDRASCSRDEMAGRLEAGDNLILFPEATSSDGNRVLPFKSALFGVAESSVRGAPLTVQPVSVAYSKLGNLPMGRHMRPFFAWYGDMDLLGHLWRALGLAPATVVVRFHPPVTIDRTGSRKALAVYCYEAVAAGVSEAINGRPPAAPRPAEAAQ
ncbi:MAG: lysophospholipid acyltransferase family protein [Alphaproteobacteria bacterium]